MNRDKAREIVFSLLRNLRKQNGSDLFITTGFPPAIKVDGAISPTGQVPLTDEQAKIMVNAIMNERQQREFQETNECNFAIASDSIGRFRVSAFVQQGKIGAVLRTINTAIPTVDGLGLSPVLKEISMTTRGLVVIVGATGAGKTTTLAAMMGYRNRHSHGHIVTVEDPVEYVHQHEQCVITQREIGVDTESWEIGLKNALRQAPNVIMIGEVRDRETMEYAIQFAETGHLCVTTLHTNNANQALDRIINFFPENRREQVLMDLSLNLRALISQRLIPSATGAGRVCAMEIMHDTPLIKDLIFKGRTNEIKDAIAKSSELGMQTFDQHLFELYTSGKITYEEAIRNADSKNELRLRVKLETNQTTTIPGLSLAEVNG